MYIINKYISKNYEVKDKFEVGIVLTGAEVKSCKQKLVGFKGAYCSFDGSGLYLTNFYIGPYIFAKQEQKAYDPYHRRKLLLHKKELNFLQGKVKEQRWTILPLRMYVKRRLIKFEIATAKGLKKYDKREKIKKEEINKRIRKLKLS